MLGRMSWINQFHDHHFLNDQFLEALSALSPTIEQLVHTIRYAERP